MTTLTKVQLVQQYFNANPTMSRKDVIAHCVAEYGLTEAGAATYYSNAKRVSTGGMFHQTQPKDSKVNNDVAIDFDKEPPTTYWVLTIVNNVVDAIHGHFQRPSKIKEGQLITTDDVEIGQDISTITLA